MKRKLLALLLSAAMLLAICLPSAQQRKAVRESRKSALFWANLRRKRICMRS